MEDLIISTELSRDCLLGKKGDVVTAKFPPLPEDTIEGLFREALAWGKVWGEYIPPHQWDEMRESMVEQYSERARLVKE